MSSSRNAVKSAMRYTLRPSSQRGHADHGWLYTYHTFSFANYQDPAFQSFGPLRVINEDRVEPGTGFGMHRHAEFLIWSYIVSGKLEHRDSLNNREVLKRGQVQFTSAGTGIRHSESQFGNDEVHFLQIWALPNVRGLAPAYYTRDFPDDLKQNKFCRIIQNVQRPPGAHGPGPEPIPLHADLTMDAAILEPSKKLVYEVSGGSDGGGATRRLYVHLIMTSGRSHEAGKGAQLSINGEHSLSEGDGIFIDNSGAGHSISFTSNGHKPAEFLLFELGDA